MTETEHIELRKSTFEKLENHKLQVKSWDWSDAIDYLFMLIEKYNEMEAFEQMYMLKTFTIDEQSDMVIIHKPNECYDITKPIHSFSGLINSGKIYPLITINGIKDKKIKIVGTKDANEKYSDSHKLRMSITNKDERHIDQNTMLLIAHKKPLIGDFEIDCIPYQSISMMEPLQWCYEDVDMTKPILVYRMKSDESWYAFRNSITINENDKLIISAINPKDNFDNIKIKFALDAIAIKDPLYDIIKTVKKLKKHQKDKENSKYEIEKLRDELIELTEKFE